MATSNVEFDQEDITRNKDMAAWGYVLFFLPLIKCKDSKLGKYCANQGLLLLIVFAAVRLILGVFDDIILVGFLFGIVRFAVSLGLVGLGIFMMVQLKKDGRIMQLPYIGHYTLIK